MEMKEEKSVEQQVYDLLEQQEITSEAALQLLVECNYTGYQPDGRITLSDAECLLSKTNVSKLSSRTMKTMYYVFCSAVAIFHHSSSRKSRSYAMKMMEQWRMMDHRNQGFQLLREFVIIDVSLALYRVGQYEESLRQLRKDLDTFCELMTLNSFHLERWRRTIKHCTYWGPFEDKRADIPRDNAVFGVLVYSYIKLGNKGKARKLLNKYGQQVNFKNNPIITYCAWELGMNQYLALDYRMEEWATDLDIFHLFHGMIYQFQMKRYTDAILVYHQCNFYAVHPIHYYRLYECYLAIGHYRKALDNLNKVESAKRNIPSVNKDWGKKWAELFSKMLFARCATCNQIAAPGVEWKVSQCSGCLKEYYCSRRCQKIAWNFGGHREKCSKEFIWFKQRLRQAKKSPFA